MGPADIIGATASLAGNGVRKRGGIQGGMTMPQRTLWMHGANMQVEYPNRITSVRATGPFVRIEGARGQNTWLHFPLPTPAVIDGARMKIDGALVSFRTREHATVYEVIVYDGDQRIAEHMDLDLRGEHPEHRVEIPGSPEINRASTWCWELPSTAQPRTFVPCR